MTSDAAPAQPVVRLEDDDFRLLGLPPRQALDLAELARRWKALQAQVHPDRFASAGAAAQRLAMQWALRVNEAYQRLRQPLSRAAYLCQLHGVPLDAERNTAMPVAFLMQQMAWREALEAATTAQAVATLASEVQAHQRAMLATLDQLIDQRQDWPAAAAQVRALMFVARFSEDLCDRQDRLDAASVLPY
ncbi:Fe-S protein assembly co-chaperone HscB [Ideonella azotifigens]|uniref:Co-chaperone protein HscB homolog n=2 Tax=Ideonella azotifigens TaxID=513160 RepID=A0ABN1JVV5_9BURK|nr:Fe-S protein assembly co-chaperone HscB [Ideonella azotifigens]MCD2343263.1 Fe-S protein assembly co-chaperone HscB [Ideonella azotifigens]